MGQALLEIGRYRMEVEGDAEKARAAFEQVAKQYPRSDAAPGAYYSLGLLALQRATTTAEIDDALAQFARVETLYPTSAWVPRSLQASALAHRRAGRYAEAADLNRRVSLEYPASDAAAAAQFEIGQALALQGQPRVAMEEFQQVRNRFPQSPWAQPALERTTALYRLYGGAKPAFAPDAAFALLGGEILKDVRALAVAPGGTLWVASEKSRSAVPFDAAGKPGSGLTAEEPRALSLDPAGEVVFAARGAVRVGPKDIRSFTTPPEKAGAAARSPWRGSWPPPSRPGGRVLVSDEERRGHPALRREGPVPRHVPREGRGEAQGHPPAGGRRGRASSPSTATRRPCACGTRPGACCARSAPRASSARWTSRWTPSATSTWPTRRAGSSSSTPRASPW